MIYFHKMQTLINPTSQLNDCMFSWTTQKICQLAETSSGWHYRDSDKPQKPTGRARALQDGKNEKKKCSSEIGLLERGTERGDFQEGFQ